ncbi:MAG TPA: VTT domain-containing protein, partial [Anaeromyxobacteraceae bacterium]
MGFQSAAAIGCALACLVGAALLPLHGRGFAPLVSWARGAPALGVAVFVLAQVLSALLLIPSWPLRVGAGFVYGAALGFAIAVPASFAATTAAFFLGRRVLRGRVAVRVARDPWLADIDDAIAEGGPWIVLLLRLSPLFPNELVNYALGATRVRFREYALASMLGMLPLTATYTWLGSLPTALDDLTNGRPVATGAVGQVLWWGGLVSTVGVAILGAVLARRALERALGART